MNLRRVCKNKRYSGGNFLPLAEFTTHVRELNLQEERRLAEKLERIKRQTQKVLQYYHVQKNILNTELQLIKKKETLPLRNILLPHARFSQVGYAEGFTERRPSSFNVIKREALIPSETKQKPHTEEESYLYYTSPPSSVNGDTKENQDDVQKRTPSETRDTTHYRPVTASAGSSTLVGSLLNRRPSTATNNSQRRHSIVIPRMTASSHSSNMTGSKDDDRGQGYKIEWSGR